MTAVKIVRAQQADFERVVALMSLAFPADPTMRWIYPDPKAYFDHFPGFTRAFGGGAFEHGTAFIEQAFGGAALWFPPGEGPDDSALSEHMVATVPHDELPSMGSLFEQMGDYRPDEAHWYLPMIGVDSGQRGRGIGSALMGSALDVIDEAGLPAYLESSNPANITLYQRHGFEAMGQIRGSEDGPILTPMYRSARRA